MKRIDEIKKMAKEYADKNDAKGSIEWIHHYKTEFLWNLYLDLYDEIQKLEIYVNE